MAKLQPFKLHEIKEFRLLLVLFHNNGYVHPQFSNDDDHTATDG